MPDETDALVIAREAKRDAREALMLATAAIVLALAAFGAQFLR